MRYLLLCIALILAACSKPDNTLTVGTIAGPETTLMEVAKTVAKEKYQLTLDIRTFNDYILPNIALNDGSIDANVFQHQPYLDAMVKSRGLHLISIGKTFIYPMAAYSKTMTSIEKLPDNAIVALPNDPSNETRALLLLEKAHLISLKKVENPSILDVKTNPKHLIFKAINAAQLPRVLDDVSLAIINTNFAIQANLSPKRDGLIVEDKHSPYANVIVIREKDKNKPLFKKLVAALQSEAVLKKAQELFHGEAIQAWS